MQMYIVQFKQYQGIILIFLKHVDNGKLQDGNCNAALGFLPQRQTKLLLFQKTLAHNRKTSNNLAMRTVLWRISEFSYTSRLLKWAYCLKSFARTPFHKPQHAKKKCFLLWLHTVVHQVEVDEGGLWQHYKTNLILMKHM